MLHRKLLLAVSLAMSPILPEVGLSQTSSALPTLAASPAVQVFDQFRRPEFIEAFYAQDLSAIRGQRVSVFRYVMPIITELGAPEVWYRLGQDLQVMLDPQLAPIARGIAMSDEGVLRAQIEPGMSAMWQMFTGLAEQRAQSIERGVIDPIGEMAAMNRGFLRGISGHNAIVFDGQHDAKTLILLAQYDPDAF